VSFRPVLSLQTEWAKRERPRAFVFAISPSCFTQPRLYFHYPPFVFLRASLLEIIFPFPSAFPRRDVLRCAPFFFPSVRFFPTPSPHTAFTLDRLYEISLPYSFSSPPPATWFLRFLISHTVDLTSRLPSLPVNSR